MKSSSFGWLPPITRTPTPPTLTTQNGGRFSFCDIPTTNKKKIKAVGEMCGSSAHMLRKVREPHPLFILLRVYFCCCCVTFSLEKRALFFAAFLSQRQRKITNKNVFLRASKNDISLHKLSQNGGSRLCCWKSEENSWSIFPLLWKCVVGTGEGGGVFFSVGSARNWEVFSAMAWGWNCKLLAFS